MKETKKCFVGFSLSDQECMEAYLEEQAEQGWMLEKLGSMFWQFRRTESKKLRFAVLYFANADEYQPQPNETLNELYMFCEHDGWVPINNTGRIQIFCNEDTEATPIETDPAVKVELLNHMWKKSKGFGLWLALLTVLFQLGLDVWMIGNMPLNRLSNPYMVTVLWLEILIAVYATVVILQHAVWYRKARRKANEEQAVLPLPSGDWMFGVGWFLAMLAVISLRIFSVCRIHRGIVILLGTCLFICAIAFFLQYAIAHGKRKGISGRKNRGRSTGILVVSCVIYGLLFGFALVTLGDGGYLRSSEPIATRENDAVPFDIYRDKLPLTLEALWGENVNGEYSYEMRIDNSSFLLDYQTMVQQPCDPKSSLSSMNCSVVKVKKVWMYGICEQQLKKEMTHDYGEDAEEDFERLLAVDATAWNAKKVYRLCHGDDMRNEFLLCYDRCLVKIRFEEDAELTEKQMRIIGEVFGK